MLPGMCGILAGSLYRLNVFYIRKAKVILCIMFFRNYVFMDTSFPKGMYLYRYSQTLLLSVNLMLFKIVLYSIHSLIYFKNKINMKYF